MKIQRIAVYLSVLGVGNFLSSILISVTEKLSCRNKGSCWFVDNLNKAHLDYFYWLLASLSAVNLCIYMFLANCYKYRNLKNSTCYSKCVLVCIGLPFSYQWHCIWQWVYCSYPLLCLACFGLHVTRLSPCCLHKVSIDISLSIKSWHLGLLYTSLHVAFSSGSLPSSMIVGLWVNCNCMQDFSIVHRL